MSVTNILNKVVYTGDGETSVFPFAFKIFADTDLVVEKVTIATGSTSTLVLTTDYTVSGAGSNSGGEVTLEDGALSDAYKLVIRRVLPLKQEVRLTDYEATPASVLEEVYDRNVMIAQQLLEYINRGILADPTQSNAFALPFPISNRLIGWNSAGTALENKAALDADVQDNCEAAQAAAEVAQGAAEAAAALFPTITAGSARKAIVVNAAEDAFEFGYNGFVDRGDPSAADYAVGDLTMDSDWHDLDLSAIVPAGAKAVVLLVRIQDDSRTYFQLRKNGLSNAIAVSRVEMQVAGVPVYADVVVGLDANRVIEYFGANGTDVLEITVKGWIF